jgi:hypothetical protein
VITGGFVTHFQVFGLQPTVLNHDRRALERFGTKNDAIEPNPFIVMPKSEGADRFHGLIKVCDHAMIVLQ